MDAEIRAMEVINTALAPLDESGRARVLKWAAEKFGVQATTSPAPTTARSPSATSPKSGEIAGIAKLTDAGELKLTVRDLKAASANDAAVRLAHIAIRAYSLLTGEQSVSSKTVIVPLLKAWRVYDGNTRMALARQKGIVRSGDSVQLDVHAEADADRFIAEVSDPSIEGAWSPNRKKK